MEHKFNEIAMTIFFTLAIVMCYGGHQVSGTDKALLFLLAIIFVVMGWACIIFDRINR